jgi:hypothetical protein
MQTALDAVLDELRTRPRSPGDVRRLAAAFSESPCAIADAARVVMRLASACDTQVFP